MKPQNKPAQKRADKVDPEAAVLAKIAAMPAPFSAMGKRLHALIHRELIGPNADRLSSIED